VEDNDALDSLGARDYLAFGLLTCGTREEIWSARGLTALKNFFGSFVGYAARVYTVFSRADVSRQKTGRKTKQGIKTK